MLYIVVRYTQYIAVYLSLYLITSCKQLAPKQRFGMLGTNSNKHEQTDRSRNQDEYQKAAFHDMILRCTAWSSTPPTAHTRGQETLQIQLSKFATEPRLKETQSLLENVACFRGAMDKSLNVNFIEFPFVFCLRCRTPFVSSFCWLPTSMPCTCCSDQQAVPHQCDLGGVAVHLSCFSRGTLWWLALP